MSANKITKSSSQNKIAPGIAKTGRARRDREKLKMRFKTKFESAKEEHIQAIGGLVTTADNTVLSGNKLYRAWQALRDLSDGKQVPLSKLRPSGNYFPVTAEVKARVNDFLSAEVPNDSFEAEGRASPGDDMITYDDIGMDRTETAVPALTSVHSKTMQLPMRPKNALGDADMDHKEAFKGGKMKRGLS